MKIKFKFFLKNDIKNKFNNNNNLYNYIKFIFTITSLLRIKKIENIRNLFSKRKLSIIFLNKIINNKDSKRNN